MALLRDLIAQYKDDLTSIARISCTTVAVKTINRTPVDEGTLRRSWTPAIGRIDFSNHGGDLTPVINRLQIGDRFTLGNGQPYVRVIEYEAHSSQAPQGMMRISVAEWDQIVADAARKV